MAFLVNAMVKVVGNESSLKRIGTLPIMTSIKQPSTRFHLWWKMWCVISTIPKWVRFPQRSDFFWMLPFFGPWKWLLFFHYSFITLTKTNINGIIKTAGLFNSSLRFLLVSTYYRYFSLYPWITTWFLVQWKMWVSSLLASCIVLLIYASSGQFVKYGCL